MTYTTAMKTTGLAHSAATPEAAKAHVRRRGAKLLADVDLFIDTVWTRAEAMGIRPEVPFGQFLDETATGTSFYWTNHRNPGGLRITYPGEPSKTWANGRDAALGMLHRLSLYIHGYEHPAIADGRPHDPMPEAVAQAGYSGVAKRLADLSGRWAQNPNYANQIASHLNIAFPGGDDLSDLTSDPPQGEAPMTKPTIILVAGHRSDHDSGNPNEKQRTPALANAYLSAFRAAGYRVHYVQNEDGDGRPDITSGGLDTVSQKTRQIMQGISGPMVLLDLHFEGAPARGVFAIVPDVTGLRTAVAGGAPADDTWANNTLDVQLAGVIARKIAAATGLPLRQTTQPGIMSERHTGVGYQGYRLATMAYSAWCRDRAVRLVVEHGSLPTSDVNIINQPGFYEKCAAAAVAAVNTVYGVGTQPAPKPEPTPKPTMPKLPKGLSVQMVRRLYNPLGIIDPDTGKRAVFSEENAAALAWLRHGLAAIPNGKEWKLSLLHGGFGPLAAIIRRGNGGHLYQFVGFAHELDPEKDAA